LAATRPPGRHLWHPARFTAGRDLQFEAERARRLQVDNELELGGLNDRQVGGLRALENLTAHYADLPKPIHNISPVTRQPSDELLPPVGG
jgi:hypothetical protein